ncbi:MAG: metallophosphoesterase [Candidatus Aminicenantes bacterium]|nr:metallophosphoesterase [Candidatus Aminicenantes bacterium]
MIGILSDSHDNLDAGRRAVRFLRNAGCSLVIHAGDFVAPFSAQILGEVGCAVKAVFGNCDGEKYGLKAMIGPIGTIRKAPFVFSHEGKKIVITHLNGPVEELSARREYDLIVYGHTHRPEIRRVENTLIVNPGEAGGWVTGRSTLALYDPGAGTAEIVFF